MKESYGTLSETIRCLNNEGYTLDFNISRERQVNHIENTILSPHDFEIDKVYRFERESNPDDQSILYAISSPTFALKGILINGYGISADEKTDALITNLKIYPVSVIQKNHE